MLIFIQRIDQRNIFCAQLEIKYISILNNPLLVHRFRNRNNPEIFSKARQVSLY